jgi:DeoR family transcriptional regulator, fructose operon transcriptional repressor
MYKEQRQKTIVNIIDDQGHVTVADLASMFKVSEMTIRRDLSELESHGLVEKTYGGAFAAANLPLSNEMHLYERMKLLADEKRRIANAIERMINPNEFIFLGSGTTTTFIAKALRFRSDVSVVTNALTVMEELATNGKMTVIGIGGFLRRNEYSFYGHFADTTLNNLHVDKVIMGMRGVHPEHGLTSDFPQEMHTDQLILKTSSNIIIAADRTKIGYVASSVLAPLSVVKIIVTSKGVNKNWVQQIQDKGVKVIIT